MVGPLGWKQTPLEESTNVCLKDAGSWWWRYFVVCILVGSPVSPSRLAEGRAALSLSSSANVTF